MTKDKATILIVDDDAIVRKSMSSFLEDNEYAVFDAIGGKEALSLFKEVEPDAVLVDLRMPGMSGLEVLKSLRRDAPNVPTIAISGTGDIDDVVEAQRNGAWDYITKPVLNMEFIIQAIEKSLEKAKLVSEKEKYQENLEGEVARRTAELVESNQKLQTALDELKVYHQDLKNSEMRYRSLFESANVGIVVLRGTSGIFSNPRLHEILEYSDEEIKEINFFDYLHPDDREYILQNFVRITSGKISRDSYECRLITGEETVKWVSIKIAHIEGEADELIFVDDITNRKRIEGEVLTLNKDLEQRVKDRTAELEEANKELKDFSEALSKSEGRYRFIVENISDVIWTTDLNLKVTYISPSVFQLRGFTPEEVSQQTPQEMFSPESLEMLITVFVEELEIEKAAEKSDPDRSQVLELEMKCKDGSTVWTELIASFIRDSEGELIGIYGSQRDIAERVASRKELEMARDAAEEANSAKSEFLANTSHEIRTPLNSIIGYLDLMKNSELGRKQREYLSIIRDSSNSLLGIINDILDLSKIESRNISIDKIYFIPQAEFESTVELFAVSASQRNIDLLLFIDPNLPQLVLGDKLRIKQVLNNLISNALKFTPEGGQVSVEILLAECDNSCTISFSITDTGIGIPEHKQSTIFEAFSQADGSVTRKFGGTGLGLTISSGLVGLMGGILQFESREGEGSSFYFSLTFEDCTIEEDKGPQVIREDMLALLYLSGSENNLQQGNVERYLTAMGVNVFTFAHEKELKKMLPCEHTIVFLECFGDVDKITEEFNELPGEYPLVGISHKRGDQSAFICDGMVDKIIFSPVNLSKISGAISSIFEDSDVVAGNSEHEQRTGKVTYNAKILVAEDNDVNQQLMEHMLESVGIEVALAGNGKEVLDMVEKDTYDIILMDINMPVMGGIEASEKLKEKKKKGLLPDMPIIAMTAMEKSGKTEKLIDECMDGYLSKPISSEKLYAILEMYIDSNKISEVKVSPHQIIDAAVYNMSEVAQQLGVKEDILKILIHKFIDSSNQYIDEIKNAISNNDFNGLYKASHKFKGTASNLRFKRLALLSNEIGENARDLVPADYSRLLDDILDELDAIKAGM